MTVYSIWESRFPADSANEGRVATEAIWRDMTHYDGYLVMSCSSTPTTRAICWW